MTNPTAVVPYHDPSDEYITILEQFLMSDENREQLPFSESNYYIPPTLSDINIADADDLLVYPCENRGIRANDFEAGPSTIHGETNQQDGEDGETNQQDGEENYNSQNSNVGNPIPLSVWPVPAVPYTCTCCQVLREITHTNGIEILKLEIHGRLGIICHAILQKSGTDITCQNHEYQMFDFCMESIRTVKQFLVQYCEERKQAGYIMLKDPLLMFYEALLVGSDCYDGRDSDDLNLDTEDLDLNIDEVLPTSPTESGEPQINQEEIMTPPEAFVAQPGNRAVRVTRSSIALQRERTARLTVRDFVEYFRIPIDDAAKQLDVCPTVLKKICRKQGLTRWPYRKIRSLEKKISKTKRSLSSNDPGERARAEADVQKFQQELAKHFNV